MQLVTQPETLDSTRQPSIIVAGNLAVTPHRKIGPHESLRPVLELPGRFLKLWLFLRLAVGQGRTCVATSAILTILMFGAVEAG